MRKELEVYRTKTGPCFGCNAGPFVYIYIHIYIMYIYKVLITGIFEFYFYFKTDRLYDSEKN